MTLLATPPTRESSEHARRSLAARAPARLGPGRGQFAAAFIGLALLVTGTVANNPSLVLLGLAAATTGLLMRWLPVDLAVPAAVLALLSTAIVSGVTAGLLGVDMLARPRALAILYLAGSAALIARTTVRPQQGPRSAVTGPGWLVLGPAATALGVGLVQALDVQVAKSWAFWGTDLARHMTTISGIQRDGALDYSVSAYPRGMHMLAGLASVPGPPLDDPATLMGYDLQLTAAMTWFAVALMLWTGTVFTLRIGRHLGLPVYLPEVSALLLGAGGLLTSSFLLSFVSMGAVPSILAVTALWAVPLAVLARVPGINRLPVLVATCCAATMVLAHMWQALAIAPVLALAAHALPRLPQARAAFRSRALRRGTLRALPFAAVTAGVAALPVLWVQHEGGAALAATPGLLPGSPWLMLAAAAICTIPLFWRLREAWVRLFLGSALGLAVAFGVLLNGTGALSGYDLWYPLKAAWFLTMLLSPMLALGAAWLVLVIARPVHRFLGRAGSAAFVLRAAAGALAVAVAFALWLPYLLGAESVTIASLRGADADQGSGPDDGSVNRSAARFDLAAKYGPAMSPAVVVPYYVGYSVVFDAYTTRLVSQLLSFQTGQAELLHEPRNLCDAITTVAGSKAAVVITKLPRQRVLDHLAGHGCAGRARIVRLPGKIGEIEMARDRIGNVRGSA